MARLSFILLLAGSQLSLQAAVMTRFTAEFAVATSTAGTVVSSAAPTITPIGTPPPPRPYCNQQGIPNQIVNYVLDNIRTPSVYACQEACSAYGMGVGCESYMFSRDDALDLQIPDRQNCALYSTVIGDGGQGLWWNSPASGEWFSDRVFPVPGTTPNATVGCYVPGDVVGDAPVEPDGVLGKFWWR